MACAPGQASSLGMLVQATDGCCNTIGSPTDTYILSSATPTITSVSSTTSASISPATATFTCSSNVACVLAWGPDSTTGVQAADAARVASATCQALLLPSWNIFISGGFGTAQNPACLSAQPQTAFVGGGIIGHGKSASGLVPTRGFNFAGCAVGGCIGGMNAAIYKDFQINGLWNYNNAGGHSNVLFYSGVNSVVQDVSVLGWAANDGTTIGFSCGAQSICDKMSVLGAGFYTCQLVSDYTDQIITKLSNSNCGNSKGPSLIFTGGALVYAKTQNDTFGQANSTTGAVVYCNNSTTWLSENDDVFGNTGGNPITVSILLADSAGCNAHFHNLISTIASTYPALDVGIGDVAWIDHSLLSGSTSFGSLLNKGVVHDDGGNTITGNPVAYGGTGVLIADGHSVKGTCTGLATASSTLGLYGTGPNATTTTCTSTTIGSGFPVSGARTLQNLVCTVGVAGTTSSTCTVVVNGSASIITCNITGAATQCVDGTHTVALNDGDRVSLEFISGGATTPTGVNAIVEWN